MATRDQILANFDRQSGEPATGYITASDQKKAAGELFDTFSPLQVLPTQVLDLAAREAQNSSSIEEHHARLLVLEQSPPVPGPPGDEGPPGPAGPPGPPGGAVLSGVWQYNTATTGPAAVGQIRTGTSLVGEGSSGKVWLNSIDADGLDWSAIAVNPSDQFYMRSFSGEQWITRVDSVDAANEYTVTLLSATGSPPRKNERIQVSLVRGGTGGGVTDHGALTGLEDDDHPQYHTDARGDARYSRTTHDHAGDYDPAGAASAAVSGHEASHAPDNAITAAQHALIDHTGLPGVGGGGGGVTDHGALTGLDDDDHPHYLNATRGDARYYTQAQVDAGFVWNEFTSPTQPISMWLGTQAQYDAIGSPDANTVYVIR